MNDVLTPQELVQKAVEDSSWNKELKRFDKEIEQKRHKILFEEDFSALETDIRDQVALASALHEYFQSEDHFQYITSMKRTLAFLSHPEVALEASVLFGDPVSFVSPNHKEELIEMGEYKAYKSKLTEMGL